MNLRLLILAIIFILTGGLAACGRGDSATEPSPDSAPNNKGHVAIVLTDAPNAEFSAINITVQEILLIGDDETQSYVLFSGEKTIDLLKLKNFSELFTLAENLPAGTYRKIRLRLKQPNGIELVRKDANGNVIETAYPQLPGNGKLDLNPRGPIVVNADATTYVQLDFDAAKSIHIVQTGNGKYQFRPVIFVDVITKENPGKLVRQIGIVHAMDQATHTLRLCTFPTSAFMQKPKGQGNSANAAHGHHGNEDESPVSDAVSEQYEPCMRVNTLNASIFDSEGKPATELAENESVMVVGFLTHTRKADDEEHYDHYRVVLDAEVIEKGALGSYHVVAGKVKENASSIDTPVTLIQANNTEVSAKLQPETKVFSRQGERLDISAIKKDLVASIDGVWMSQNTLNLRATLVILDLAKITDELHFSGTIKAIDLAHNQFQITTATGDIAVMISSATNAFAINTTTTPNLSQRIELDQLVNNSRVDVYAHTTTAGDILAEVVIMVGG